MKKKIICILVMMLLIATVLPVAETMSIGLVSKNEPAYTAGILIDNDQAPWEHSSLTTSDGSIRDDELVNYICNAIPKNETGVPQVKDVKIMFNSCYGGGFLDDFEKCFGPDGECKGVPWVFGSASQHDQTAVGWSDAQINHANNANPGSNLGSSWTSALAGPATSMTNPAQGAIRNRTTDNVKEDFEAARNNDAGGPNHFNSEDPVVAWGNGGQNIQWNESNTSHCAVIFGGSQTDDRHHNNVDNVEDALTGIWPAGSYNIQKIDGGTEQDLKDAIDNAAECLNSSEQLVLYFNDHGDEHFDFDEFLEWWLPFCIYEYFAVDFELHPGWEKGLYAMYVQPGDEPVPYLSLSLDNLIVGEYWGIALNEVPIPLPSGELTGDLQLPVDWTSIHTGTNTLEIWNDITTCPMCLDNLELCSGSINEIEVSVPESPTITGLTSGKAGEEYEYTFFTTDPTKDNVYYYIDWGDDQMEKWIGPYESGEEVTVTHTWDEKGEYTIRAKAKDFFDMESLWGYLEISMPKNKLYISTPFLQFLEQYPILYQLLERFLNL